MKSLKPTSTTGSRRSTIASYLFPVRVSGFAIVLIALSFFVGYYPYLFIHYLLALIHELAHIAVALAFKTKVKLLKLLPFGFYAEFGDFDIKKPYQQFLILVAGPLSFVISALLLKSLYLHGLFSYYTYRASQSSNLLIALFNLIPFYPLDGARLFEIGVSCFLSESRTRFVRYAVSFLALLFIGWLCLLEKQYPIMIYLAFIYALELLLWKKEYAMFLVRRLYQPARGKAKFTTRDQIYRYRPTYRLTRVGIEGETSIIKRLLKHLRHPRRHTFGIEEKIE